MSDPLKPLADESVERFFDSITEKYTAAIERCFPRYQEMLSALLRYLPQPQPATILELGAGTGNLSELLANHFTKSHLRLVDISGDSLDSCRGRLGDDARLTYQQADFRELEYPPASFDLIASSIAIHHLQSAEKRVLFEKIKTWLKPGGVFTYADQFSGATEHLYSQHMESWKQQSFAAGSTETEWAMWMQHQTEHDFHDTLFDQMNWLVEAGFANVDCTWRCMLWSVVIADVD